MSGGEKRARLLVCSVCQFETYSKGGFVWHQKSAHGRKVGSGVPGKTRGRPETVGEDDDAAEVDGIPVHARARRRVGHLAAPSGGASGRNTGHFGPGAAGVQELDTALAGNEAIAGFGALAPDHSGSYDAAIRAQLYPLLEMTRVLRDNATEGAMDPEYQYQSLATRIFSLYEVLDDAARSVPILQRRRNSRCGRFTTPRLRALQQFVLGVGGAGLSV